ncbi:major coat protein [Kushneria aurantia]|uniref:Major coat protein n=1 Tax=Kushneria aurantia TaxID=504092 RepID=A0ABV6G1M5_9GAMM|nr:major coat protein [Kushneria aurantia]
MKNKLAYLRALSQKKAAQLSTAGALTLAGIGAAQAAEGGGSGGASASYSQAFSTLESQAGDMASQAWPVVIGVVGSLLAIGLFKKFANKST